MERFDNEFVAVHKQRIVDHDKEMSHLMKRVETKYPSPSLRGVRKPREADDRPMRIPGYFNRRFQPPAPFIRVTVESKSLKTRRPPSQECPHYWGET